jgi:hypothetical protein
MWFVNLRAEIVELFREAQAPLLEKIRARYGAHAACQSTRGTCAMCGAVFDIPLHAAGLKVYCGSRCSMRQRNINRRGPPRKPRWSTPPLDA